MSDDVLTNERFHDSREAGHPTEIGDRVVIDGEYHGHVALIESDVVTIGVANDDSIDADELVFPASLVPSVTVRNLEATPDSYE